MKKSLIGTLTLGLIIGTGALTVKSFANEIKADTQLLINTMSPVVSSTDNQSLSQSDPGFKVLNQETNQFEQIDDSDYRNSNPNYRQSCPHASYGNFGNRNIN